MSLSELWQLFPIILTEHNPDWKNWFKQEKEEFEKKLPMDKVVHISHIGSTAVEGIWAKPIVDILVEVREETDFLMMKQAILQAGYLCMSESQSRISFNKGYTLQGFAERVFHLHLRIVGDNDELYFRDYLQTHFSVAKDYENLKKSLWKIHEHNRDAYTEQKTEFIKKYTQKAKIEFVKRYNH